MGNPVKGILKRLAKWVVKHGKEELEKELDKRRGDGIERDLGGRPIPPDRPPFPR